MKEKKMYKIYKASDRIRLYEANFAVGCSKCGKLHFDIEIVDKAECDNCGKSLSTAMFVKNRADKVLVDISEENKEYIKNWLEEEKKWEKIPQ
jgi:DNA-directed RNA polymerase subunit RPC12/RpoP